MNWFSINGHLLFFKYKIIIATIIMVYHQVSFQGSLGKEYSEVVCHLFLLGAAWDCAGCPRPHRLALLGCTLGN